MPNETLHLVLKRRWFDMIETGGKREEYREIKPFWAARLLENLHEGMRAKPYDYVRFWDGYKKGRRSLNFKIVRIAIGKPRTAWSDGMKGLHFVIEFEPLSNTFTNQTK